MPLDYQQILMQMNRPRRRQGTSWARVAMWFVCLAIVAGGAFSVWHFGYVDYAGEKAVELWRGYAPSWLGGSPEPSGGQDYSAMAAPAFDPEILSDSQQPVETDRSGSMTLAVPAARDGITIPAPAPVGSLSIEAESRPTRSLAPPVLAEASAINPAGELISGLTPAPTPQRQQVQAAAPAAQPAATPASAVERVPAPVLSEARAQLKNIDSLLRSDPAEALKRLETLTKTVRLQPDEAADAGYRLGYAARLLKDEAKAEKSWSETAKSYPAAVGGRFSALALADTWYHLYAGQRPQVARWDDIQEMYSLAIGEDDAPFLTPDVRSRIKANLNKLNDSIFFGSAPCKMARYHKVEQGELLGGIANKFRVDYESLARINGINPNRIRAGMDLKVVVGEVSIVVRKNAGDPNKTPTVTWFLDGRWVREYPTCVGDGNKTPAGTYHLTSKERDPSWTNPANGQLLPNNHPENILGSRWMAMKGMNTQGLGIHGTTVDDSIPGYTSAGCVRLLNKDVEELFSFARIGARVTVEE